MLLNRIMSPFLRSPSDAGPDPGSAAEGRVTSPDAVSSRNSLPATERGLDPPTRLARPGVDGGLDPVEDEEGGEGRSPASSDTWKNILSDDFDPETVPPALREAAVAMRNQVQEALQKVPSPAQIQDLYLRAQAFDRVIRSDAFRRFLDNNPEYAGEYEEGGERPAPELKGTQDPNIQKLIESLDEDGVAALQKYVDQVVSKKVQPFSDSYYADKAQANLDQLISDVGEKTFNENEAAVLATMKRFNMPAKDAFYRVIGEKLLAQQKAAAQGEIREKVKHAPLGLVTPSGTVSPSAAASKQPKSMRDAILQAEEQFEAGGAWDPSNYALHSGRR